MYALPSTGASVVQTKARADASLGYQLPAPGQPPVLAAMGAANSNPLQNPGSPWFWLNNSLYYLASCYCMVEWLRLVYHDRKLLSVQVCSGRLVGGTNRH